MDSRSQSSDGSFFSLPHRNRRPLTAATGRSTGPKNGDATRCFVCTLSGTAGCTRFFPATLVVATPLFSADREPAVSSRLQHITGVYSTPTLFLCCTQNLSSPTPTNGSAIPRRHRHVFSVPVLATEGTRRIRLKAFVFVDVPTWIQTGMTFRAIMCGTSSSLLVSFRNG